jgi:hypothetical protein
LQAGHVSFRTIALSSSVPIEASYLLNSSVHK